MKKKGNKYKLKNTKTKILVKLKISSKIKHWALFLFLGGVIVSVLTCLVLNPIGGFSLQSTTQENKIIVSNSNKQLLNQENTEITSTRNLQKKSGKLNSPRNESPTGTNLKNKPIFMKYSTQYDFHNIFNYNKMLASSNIINGYLATIFEDSRGTLWSMGYDTKLQYSKDGKIWQESKTSNITNGSGGTIFEDSRGTLWSMSDGTKLQYSKDGKIWQESKTSNITNGVFGTIFEDSRGTLWSYSPYGGKLQFSKDGNKWTLSTNKNWNSKFVSSIFEDSRGTLWSMGRYTKLQYSKDGKTWQESQSSNITDGFGGTIFEDSKGTLWSMGLNTKLQYSKDGKTWQESQSSNITDGSGGTIFEDSRGTLWSMSDGTKLQYSKDGKTWHESQSSNITNGVFGTIFEDSRGTLWSMGKKTKLQYSKDGKTWQESQSSNIINGRGGTIFEDSRGTLWSMGDGTKLQFSKDGITWFHHQDNLNNNFKNSSSNVKNGSGVTILEASNGLLWLLSQNKKLQYSVNNGESWNDAQNSNITNGYNGTIFEDSRGTLWSMGNNTKLQYLTSGSRWWQESQSSNITDGSRGIIFEDSRGTLWSMGDDTKLQYSKDGKTWQESQSSNITDGWNGTIFEDSRGTLWSMGSNTKLQYSKNGQTWHESDSSSNIKTGRGGTIFEDSRGTLWSMSYFTKLQYSKDGKIWHESQSSNIINGNSGIIFEDSRGTLWSMGDGTKLQYSKDGKTWQESQSSNMTTGYFATIFEDSRGTLWLLAQANKDIQYSIDGINWKTSSFPLEEILSEGVNGFIFEDSKGTLWVTSHFKRVYYSSIKSQNFKVDYKYKILFKNVNLIKINNKIFIKNYKWKGLKKYTHLRYKKVGEKSWKDLREKFLPNDNYEFEWVIGTSERRNLDEITKKLWNTKKLTVFKKTIFANDQNKSKTPTTTSTKNGELGFTLTNYNPDKMTLSVNKGTLDLTNHKVIGLAPNEQVTFTVALKKDKFWTDGTNAPIEKTLTGPKQTYVGLTKITIKKDQNISKPPTITSTKNGELGFTLTNYNPDKMTLSVNKGTLDLVNHKVTGLAPNEQVIFTVTPKKDEFWTDGTNAPIEIALTGPKQTYVGLMKITIKKDQNISKPPTTTSTKNGELGFTLTNYNPDKMTLSVNKGTLDLVNHKVIGLAPNEQVTFSVTLKKDEFWTDGTNDAIKKSLTGPKQTYVGLTKITIKKDQNISKPPTTTSTKDGELGFTLTNYNPDKMTLSVNKGTLDLANHKVTGLAPNEQVIFTVTPKKDEFWTDGTNDAIKKSLTGPKQTYVGLTKITIKKDQNISKPPTTTSTKDGELGFTLTNYNPDKMILSVNKGTLDLVNHKVTGLAPNEQVTFTVTPKADEFWTDGTNAPIEKSLTGPKQTYVGLTKITIKKDQNISKPPTTTSTKDGELGFILTNYNPDKMTLSVNKGTLDLVNHKVTGLAPNEQVIFTVTPKKDEFWTDGTNAPIEIALTEPSQTYVGLMKITIKKDQNISKTPTTTSTKNGELGFTLTNYNPDKMTLSVNKGTLDLVNHKVTGLAPNEQVTFTVTLKKDEFWTDGTNAPIEIALTGPKQTYVGLMKITIKKDQNISKPPTTTSTKDGELGFILTNYNPDKMTLSVNKGTLDLVNHKVTGLAPNEQVIFTVTPKKDEFWTDGTNAPIEIALTEPSQTYVGLMKITIKKDQNISKTPTTTSTKNGELGFTLTNYNPDKMTLSVNKGTLDLVNHKVTGLAPNEQVIFTVTPKKDEFWTDGTNAPIEIALTGPKQTYVGLMKITIKKDQNISKPPTTTSTKNGELGFTLTNYNPDKMTLSVNKGTLDLVNHKVIGLAPNEQVTFSVTLKKDEFWTDGTNDAIKKSLTGPKQTYVGLTKITIKKDQNISKPPTTTSTKDGELGFTLTNYNPDKMTLSVNKGTLDLANHKVTGLAPNEQVIFTVTPKKDEFWTDGTNDAIKKSLTGPKQTYVGLTKITIKKDQNISKPPTTTSTKNGELGFTLTNYNPDKMTLSVNKGTLDLVNHKVTGLAPNEQVTFTVTLKKDEFWTDGTNAPIEIALTGPKQTYVGLTKITIKKDQNISKPPTTTSTKDGELGFTLTNYNPDKMTLSVNKGTLDLVNHKVTGLAPNEQVTFTVTLKKDEFWTDGTNAPIEKSLTGPKQTYVGLMKITIKKDQNISKPPTTTSTKNGELGFTLTNYNPDKMTLSVNKGTLDLVNHKVTGLAPNEQVIFTVTPKKDEFWTDGTNAPIEIALTGPSQTYVGLTKITIKKDQNISKPPTTTSTKDGELGFTLINYNPDKMTLSVNKGTLDLVNHKVTGLTPNEQVIFTVTPKKDEFWTDGTNAPIEIALTEPKQTYVGLTKITIKKDQNISKPPTTTSTKNGELGFTLTNYNPDKMILSVNKGTLDLANHKVTGLASNEQVTFTVTLKKDEFWTDGTNAPIKKSLTASKQNKTAVIKNEKLYDDIINSIIIVVGYYIILNSVVFLYRKRRVNLK